MFDYLEHGSVFLGIPCSEIVDDGLCEFVRGLTERVSKVSSYE